MKKLMIAAAVAAMIGGAFATDYVYDFSATLKTTGVKTSSQTRTYTVNVGKNSEGKYWWDCLDLGYTTADQAKKALKGMTDAEKREIAIGWTDDDGEHPGLEFDEDLYDLAIAMGGKAKDISATPYYVTETYKGKEQWCFSFTYKVTDTECYRVAGSKKISHTLYVDDCCNAWAFEDGTTLDPIMGEADLFYRFGSLTFAKSTKVELAGAYTIASDAAKTVDGRVAEFFTLAGQGTWSDKLYSYKIEGDKTTYYYAGISSVSGNIAGYLENPGCKDCCNYAADALCFQCDGTGLYANLEAEGYKPSQAAGTAAWGTWTIKFNKKASFQD